MKTFPYLLTTALGLACAPFSHAGLADKVVRTKVAGIDLVAYPSEVKDVVTFRGSLPAGDSFAPADNLAVATLVGDMLDEGTVKHDKYEIARQLESVGASIGFGVDGVVVTFAGKCLRKDLPLTISLLAEELRTPAFSETEFAKVKKQLKGDLQHALESTNFRAEAAYAQAIYPVGHPNYQPPIDDFIAAIDHAKVADLKKFHAAFYGPAAATLVVVGDFDPQELQADVAKAFDGWKGGQPMPHFPKAPAATTPRDLTITMPDKTNVSVLIGQTEQLQYTDPDSLPLRLGTAVLGTGFTGRLMANVRDKEGLTYGIYSAVQQDAFADGDWVIGANFAPALLDQGLASTKRQLDLWHQSGITAAELDRTKANIIGSFKVNLATTDGMATVLLNALHRGYDEHWLDQFPERVQALTLEQVNDAIKKHINLDTLTVIKAGTVKPKEPEKE